MEEQNEKQAIAEMANILEQAKIDAHATIGSMNYGFGMWYAKACYNAGYRKQEWISVEDRLPDGQGHFLTVDDTGYIMVAMWTNQFGWFSHICKANKITHWMPLPEPPKMKGGAEL